MTDEEREYNERMLRQDFERRLPLRLDRQARIPVHPALPTQFFAQASAECRHLFFDERFYGCIVLTQAVVEGISKFVGDRKKLRTGSSFKQRIEHWKKLKPAVISERVCDAFLRVHGNDRHDFHHLNSNVEQDKRELERRAEECLLGLYEIQSELFACPIVKPGELHFVNPEYWDIAADGGVRIYADCV